MQLPKIDVQQRRLSELLYEMQQGKLQVPRFQRNFVWPVAKTRALLDSMYKEFPIGTFFLWRAPQGSPPLSRPLEEVGIPAAPQDSEVAYILDGQQRLTSLYVTIKGRKLGHRDYGRICIDLETASRYEESSEEGFDESIFVYRKPDNSRYVAVTDLVGDNHLSIFNGIPETWKPAFNKAYNLFITYPFSVVWIREQQLGDAVTIFQRINQAGKRLSRYDLVCANVWREDFDFRKSVAQLNQQFSQQGFGVLHETIYTQTFAMVLLDRCTTAAELSLSTDQIIEVWDRAVRAVKLAVEFVRTNLGVVRSDHLPYRGILVVLAYYFFHAPSSALSAADRRTLWQWFWQVTLSERYSSTSPSRMAEDARELRAAARGEEVTIAFPSRVTSDSVARTKMTTTSSALRNAFVCMLALRQPRDLKDGSPVNLGDGFFSNLKKAERHHVFPVGYIRNRGWSVASVNLLPNFCFIPADLNREIGSQAPADYLSQYREANSEFAVAAASHLLPVGPDAAVWDNDFQAFLKERAHLIAVELNRLADSPLEPLPARVVGSILADRVDALEVRLRDFIDARLSAVTGPYYWRHTMPGDVIVAVRDLIGEHLSRHPYDDQSMFASGRRKLDFCDVSHYEKIVLKNWSVFGEIFQRKDEFQRHMASYRILRNAVQHNREPSDIERLLGEAAMTWLERILNRYDEEAAEVADEDEEIVPEQVMG